MHRLSPLVPLDRCLNAAACLSSACSFAVSHASDLALLVWYLVSKDSFSFRFLTFLKENASQCVLQESIMMRAISINFSSKYCRYSSVDMYCMYRGTPSNC